MSDREAHNLHEAAKGLLATVDRYPPEILDEGEAWRVGGMARRAWQLALRDLRSAWLNAEENPKWR